MCLFNLRRLSSQRIGPNFFYLFLFSKIHFFHQKLIFKSITKTSFILFSFKRKFFSRWQEKHIPVLYKNKGSGYNQENLVVWMVIPQLFYGNYLRNCIIFETRHMNNLDTFKLFKEPRSTLKSLITMAWQTLGEWDRVENC